MKHLHRKLEKHSENKWAVLALLAIAQFMVVLDVSIVNVALPSLAKDLHFSPSNLQWVVTAYTLTFGGLLLLGGRAADIFGRKKLFTAAVLLFSAASLLCGLAQTEAQLIIARAIQGVTGALMSPVALSIVLSEFKEGKERNKAMGVWGGVAAGGGAVGGLLGGIFTEYLNWRWNFFVNVPIGLIVAMMSLSLIPAHLGEETKRPKLDVLGALFATTGLMSLVYGLSCAPTDGWGSGKVWGFIAAGAALLVLFVLNERRTKEPLMPLEVFKIRNVAGGNLAFLGIACSLFSMFFFMTLYLQNVLGYSPIKAGVSFLPITIIIGATSAVVSNLVGKFGYKPFMLAGPLILATGLFTISQIMKVGGTYWANVFPGLALCALGMGLTFVSGTLAATSGVPKHFSGLAAGILNTSQQVGGAIGLAIISAVAFTSVKGHLAARLDPLVAQVHGYQNGLKVGALLAFLAALIVLVVIKNHKVDAHDSAAAVL